MIIESGNAICLILAGMTELALAKGAHADDWKLLGTMCPWNHNCIIFANQARNITNCSLTATVPFKHCFVDTVTHGLAQ